MWPVPPLPFVEGLDEQRCRARDEQAHVAHRFACEARLGEQAHVERRHAHEHGGFGQLGDDALGVELREPQHLAAVEQCTVQRDEEAVHVEDRQRVNEHVARRPAPVVLEHLGVRQQVAVREHRALAASGGAARVEDRGEVVGRLFRGRVLVAALRRHFEQRAGAVVVQREHVPRARRIGDGPDPRCIAAGAHHDRGLGVADEVFDLGALVGGVERQEHIARAQRREVQQHRLDGFFDLHRDARALLELERIEQVGDHRARAFEVAPRIEQAVVGLDCDAVEVGGKGRAQGGEQVGVGWLLHRFVFEPVLQKFGVRLARKAAMPSRCSAESA